MVPRLVVVAVVAVCEVVDVAVEVHLFSSLDTMPAARRLSNSTRKLLSTLSEPVVVINLA